MTTVQNLIQHKTSLNKDSEDVRRDQKEAVLKAKTTGVGDQLRHAMSTIQEIRVGRPFYGTRRVAAKMSRRLGRVVNRKTVRRIYKKTGLNKLGQTQSTKTHWTPIKADRPNEV